MLEFESILDVPRETLDPSVWKLDSDGVYKLTDEAENSIQTLVDFVKGVFNLENPSVRITGSITSNQYSDDSDIDIHISFDGLNDDNSEYLNKMLHAEFEENFKDMYTDKMKIGGHPLEVYFQPNPFQDLMSVGCYDFVQKMWIVGPSLKPLDFDPYSEYYSEDMEYVKDVIADIRNIILECYETAMVIQNSSSGEFRDQEYSHLLKKLHEAVDIFRAAKQCRKVYSQPKSVEDALKRRESRKWKIADSSFKLMDKFGYLKILKKFSKIVELLDSGKGGIGMDDITGNVIDDVRGGVDINESIDESIKNLGKYLALASFLVLPGILPREALAKNLSQVSPSQLNIASPEVQTAIQKSSKDETRYGGHTASNIINMVARTLYVEGHSQGTKGRKAILSVIKNRADGKMENVPAVLKEKQAFSCWNKMNDGDWRNFVYKIPSSGPLSIIGNNENRKIWNECVSLAIDLFDGNF